MLVELLIHQGIFYEVILDFLPFFFGAQIWRWIRQVNLAGCKGKKKKKKGRKKLIFHALYLVK